MTSGVYGIFATEDDECLFLGQSKDVEARFRTRLQRLRSKSNLISPEFVAWYHTQGARDCLIRFELLEACDEAGRGQAFEAWHAKLLPRFNS